MHAVNSTFLATTEELKRGGTSGAKSSKESWEASKHLSLVKNPPAQLNWATPVGKEVASDTITCQTTDLFDLVVSILQSDSVDARLAANRLKEFFQPTKADVYRYIERSYCTPLQAEVGFLNEEASEILDLLMGWI